MPNNWEQKISEYCEKYNIPIENLAETLYEPKVIPMIRGKAFEFSVATALRSFLDNAVWTVNKVPMNAQQGTHDIDVEIVRRGTNIKISGECKLAGKGRFRALRDGSVKIAVKCMRSRTLGAAMVAQLAPQRGVSVEQLQVHNDQYLPADFDIVITSIGNAFYATDPQTGSFVWAPSDEGSAFLERLKAIRNVSEQVSLKDFAFNQMYVAKASNLAIANNGVNCTRGGCANVANCGFIPNYPVISFDQTTLQPSSPWVELKSVLGILQDFVE